MTGKSLSKTFIHVGIAKLFRPVGVIFVMCLAVMTLFMVPNEAKAQMGPDYWKVAGVASNDTLNLRAGPGTSNRVVARAPNGSVFRNLGCKGTGNSRWCHLETPDGRISGWASGRYLVESAAPRGGNASGSNEVPELHARYSGEIEVRFASGCTALYNPVGHRINAGRSCSRAQLTKGHDAVASFLRENSPTANHSGGGSANANVNIRGNGTIYGGGATNGSIVGHKEGAYALVISADRLVCTGLLKHAPGVVRTEAASVHCSNGANGTGVLAANRNGRGHTMTFTLTDGTGGYVLFN